MISENLLKRLGGSLTLNRARTIAARGYPIFDRRLSYRRQLTVLRASVDDAACPTGVAEPTVTIDENANAVCGYACSCEDSGRADRSGPCKHCLAVVLDYNRNMRSYEGYDPTRFVKTSSCVAAYLDRAGSRGRMRDGQGQDERGSVDFLLELSFDLGEWNARFKLKGAHGSYVLQSVSDFMENLRDGVYVSYGKKLGFVHAPDAFTPHGREVTGFLERALIARRSLDPYARQPFGLGRVERDLRLSPLELDELLRIFEAQGFQLKDAGQDGRARAARVIDADPPLSMALVPTGGDGFELVRGRQMSFVDCARSLYAWKGGDFYRCSQKLREASDFLMEVYASPVRRLFVSEEDAKRFVPVASRLLEDAIGLEIPAELESLRPQPCSLEFYMDRLKGGVGCRPFAAYGGLKRPLFSSPEDAGGIDEAAEAQARELMRRYFDDIDEEACFIPDSDIEALGRLAFEGVPELQRLGTVFASPEFKELASDARPRASIGLSIRSHLVDVDFRLEGLSQDELHSLLASYRLRRDYHRLKNGTIIRIAGVDLSSVDEAAGILGAGKAKLDAGRVTAPAYEAFALEGLADEDGKDESFLSWMDSFRTIDEAAYQPPEGLNAELRPYQLEGFRWLSHLADLGFGGILADEMGLGKTLQLICFLLARRDEARETGPSIVVCPASLVYNWAAEFERFAPGLVVEAVAGDARERAASRAKKGVDVFVTSYDLLKRDIEGYAGMCFWCEALDEAQHIKNQGTRAAASVKALDAAHRFALTGTPIENRVSEAWSIFDYLMPGLLGSYRSFRDRFEAPIMDGDEEKAARLAAMIGPFMLRRRKSEVLRELPEKCEAVLYARLEGEQLALYQAHEQILRQKLAQARKTGDGDAASDGEGGRGASEGDGSSGHDRMEILAELTRLRQLALDPSLLYADYQGGAAKTQAIMETIGSCMESGEKMLVFSQFTSYLDILAKELEGRGVKHCLMTGSTPKKRRLELVKAFNADDTPVFLISLKAGGTGLNLTGASAVLHADPWWNAAAQDQATDRAHRMGQTQAVNVYKVIAKDTIEERILKLQEAKSDLAERLLGAGGASLAGLTKEELLELLG